MAATTKDPRKVAAKAVDEWFHELVFSSDAHINGLLLEDAFTVVQDALEALDQKKAGAYDADKDAAVRHEVCAREAGYLVGLEVGLRLRAVR